MWVWNASSKFVVITCSNNLNNHKSELNQRPFQKLWKSFQLIEQNIYIRNIIIIVIIIIIIIKVISSKVIHKIGVYEMSVWNELSSCGCLIAMNRQPLFPIVRRRGQLMGQCHLRSKQKHNLIFSKLNQFEKQMNKLTEQTFYRKANWGWCITALNSSGSYWSTICE